MDNKKYKGIILETKGSFLFFFLF